MSANSGDTATISRSLVEDFYYDEADILDQFRFRDWLDMLTDEVRYRIPIRSNRMVRGRTANELNENDLLFDEDKRGLTQRVKRLETGRAWAEEPRSRTRHLVTNVRVRPTGHESQFHVTSNFIAYRNRLEVEQDFFVGTREDVLHLNDGRLKISSRLVLLDQAVLTAKNMTILF